MTLRQRQSTFIKNFAMLILWAFDNGFEVTAGELHRTDEQHQLNRQTGKTRANRSLHQDRLAGDLNLFIDGKYITDTSKYKPLGEYWVSLHPDNRWGGDWDKDGDHKDERFSDGNHFEMSIR
jgi:hypothetical protein